MGWGRRTIAFLAAIAAPCSGAGAQIADFAKVLAADPLAAYVKASGWVPTARGAVFVELLLDEKNAALRLRTATNQTPELRVLTTPAEALKLLADKRMQFLWQPLTEWAGPTLDKMRERTAAQLRAAAAAGNADLPPETTSESAVRPRIRALIQLAGYLIDTGQPEDAERLLQDQLATMKVRTDGSSTAMEWFSVAAWIATARWARGDADGAVRQYEFIERTLGNSPYAANATISRASFLAQKGRYAEALNAIDPLWQRWQRETREYKIGGSERQFAWIRACALEGLARHAAAEAAFQPVTQARDTRDPYYVIEPDDALKLKGRVCMKQPDAVVALLADELQNALSPGALLLLQPAYRPQTDVDLWQRVRSDTTLAKLAGERMRILPTEMTPALNGWR